MTRPKSLIEKLLNERRRQKPPCERNLQVEAENAALGARLAELADVLNHRLRDPAVSPQVLEHLFRRHGVERFCARVQAALMASPYPSGVPAQTRVLAYRPEGRELIVERELPADGVIPAEQQFRLVHREMQPVARHAAQVRQLYRQLLACCALRTLAEVFAMTPPSLVESVVLNGRVTSINKTTGVVSSPHLLSVQLTREAYDNLQLDGPELDPELCLQSLNALISPQPHDMVPIEPLLRAS